MCTWSVPLDHFGGSSGEQVRPGALPDGFAARFNDEFRPYLHALVDPATPAAGTGIALTPERLGALFTPEQIGLLADFMDTRRIPERLFNGVACRSALTAQMRILVASHILESGTYASGPRDATGEAETPTQDAAPEADEAVPVEARCCRHWVQLVHAYAGLTPPGGVGGGVQQSVDHAGNMVLPEGSARGRGGATNFNNEAGGERVAAFVSDPSVLVPGDWIEIAWPGHRGNPAEGQERVGDTHSAILVRVVNQGDPDYRVDYVSQNVNPETRTGRRRGNREVSENVLMSRYLNQGRPVIYGYTHVSDETDPAERERTLLGSDSQTEAEASGVWAANQSEIRRRIRPGDGAEVDAASVCPWLTGWLRERNTEQIATLGDRLSEVQVAALEAANREGSDPAGLERAIRLNERLRILIDNRDEVAASDVAQEQFLEGAEEDEDIWITHRNGITGDELTGEEERRGVALLRTTGLLTHLPAGYVPWRSYAPGA